MLHAPASAILSPSQGSPTGGADSATATGADSPMGEARGAKKGCLSMSSSSKGWRANSLDLGVISTVRGAAPVEHGRGALSFSIDNSDASNKLHEHSGAGPWPSPPIGFAPAVGGGADAETAALRKELERMKQENLHLRAVAEQATERRRVAETALKRSTVDAI